MLFTAPTDEFSSDGLKIFSEQIKGAFAALKEGLNFETATEQLTSIEKKAITLQRTIGSGVVIGTDSFRQKLTDAYTNVSKLGGTFSEVTDVVTDLNAQMGKIVIPTQQAIEDMVILGKTTGVPAKEIGKMVGELNAFTLSTKQSITEITNIAKVARKFGLESKTLLKSVEANISKLNAYNFKGGLEGLTKMTAQAQKLGTTVEKLGAIKFAEELIDPEKAIEAAAGFSMLGGSVEGLSNPFQLMNDAANNVDALQEKMIELGKSAYSIDEATGEIKTNFLAQQRLREQVKLFSGDYEEYMKAGKMAAKEQLIQNKLLKEGIDTSKISEESMSLVKSLSEVGAGGKLELSIPGFETDDLANTIKNNAPALQKALEDYQAKAAMSEKDIAQQQLSIAEKQSIDVTVIREAILRRMTGTQQAKLLKDVESLRGTTMAAANSISTTLVPTAVTALTNIVATGENVINETKNAFDTTRMSLTELQALDKLLKGGPATDYTTTVTPDAAIPEGNNGLVKFSKGEIFSFIKEDQAIVAPDAIKNFNILKDVYTQVMGVQKATPNELKITSPKEITNKTQNISNPFETINNTTKTETNSTQTINVNITVDGKNVSTMTNLDPSINRDIEKKIKDTIQNISFWEKSKSRIATKR
jgi:hypothetical protein